MPSRWWREFGSSELDGLVEKALANNHDLKAAVARISQAQALAGVSAEALLPTIGYSGGGQVSSPNGGVGVRPAATPIRLYQLGLSATYELDFWGKNRFAEEAALASAQANVFDRETVALTLVANVAASYLQFLSTSDRIAAALHNVENMTRVLETVRKRRNVGEGTDVEITQQATALAQAKAVVPPLRLFREQTRNQLAVLLGELPEELELSGQSLDMIAVPELPAALPSELLVRRPDLRKAQADLVSANAGIGQARAKLLPSFTLTGERGIGSHYLSDLLSPASFFYLVAVNFTGPIFDNGRTLSEIDFAKAVYGERVEVFRQATLTALRDVENALAAVHLTAEAEMAQTEAWNNARKAYDLSQMAYRSGVADYLTILETERSLYQTEDLKVQARFDRLNAAVSLFQSLGGGTAEGRAQ